MKHIHIIKNALLVATLVAVGSSVGLGLRAQEQKRGKHLTAAEYKALVAKDPVLQFVERVNERAVNDPIWNENYALALYRTFGDEARQHLIDLGIGSIGGEEP